MKNKIETVIYGGAFNPPTLAHLKILEACIAYAHANDAEVWVLPSGNRTDKQITVSRERRMQYLEALVNDAGGGVLVQTFELDRQGAIETIDTVRELEQRYPERTFRFVFGADSTETMANWQDGHMLLETLPMLIVERVGSSINPKAIKVERLTVQTPPVSSTEVRQRLAAGAPVDHLVPPSVSALLV